jgi:tRNA G46 methylase TrmB
MISLRFLILIFLLSQPFRLYPQSQNPAAPDRQTSQPYSGDLSIFESPGRDKRLQIDRVMDILGIGPGKAVADIGAGSGWFTVRAARKVTPTGNVYAVDINPEAIRYIKNRATQEKLTNIQRCRVNRIIPCSPRIVLTPCSC